MYEQHFGLKKRPFRANVSGTDVFVGPNIAATMADFKNGLTSNDAIVAVSGPVGSGKTTLVNRALESMGRRRKVVLVARMRLNSNDVLELLLDELGLEDKPAGTIQKFTRFRHRLKELAAIDTHVHVVIEDAVRLGVDTMAEIEALTAADAGESDGASVILMGDGTLDMVLREAPLARLQQRIRQRLTTAALPAAELRGYLRHCFRLAGGDFDRIFESNAAELLHHLSDGILRMSNNLVESAMTAAADQDLPRVATALLSRVAENEYGLSATDFSLTRPTEPVPSPLPELAVEAPVLVFADPRQDTGQESQLDAGVPELIQDTLPELEILTPKIAADVPVPEQEREPLPETLSESSADEVPAWDRDPTMEELKPDFAVLEQAMAIDRSDDPGPVVDEPTPRPVPQQEKFDVMPEITLDHAISQRIESNLIDNPGEIAEPAPGSRPESTDDSAIPTLDSPREQNKKADVELEKIAAELAKVKSIEDIDAKLAETLFGDEINFVAAQFLANPPSAHSANDEHDVVATGEKPELTLKTPKKLKPIKLDDRGMSQSASQRLKTVRALNADPNPSIREPEAAAESVPESTTEFIEHPINTSMTETLKALNVTPPVLDDGDDDDRSGGFFSRFKRT